MRAILYKKNPNLVSLATERDVFSEEVLQLIYFSDFSQK